MAGKISLRKTWNKILDNFSRSQPNMAWYGSNGQSRFLWSVGFDGEKNLGEIGRDEENRLAGAARGAELCVDELDRADVDAARWLRSEEHLKLASHFAGDDDLLLVAA